MERGVPGAGISESMNNEIHILSLGAGVQSSAMALMASCGEITPMPVCAIFADTQAEPKAVYDYLDWLEKNIAFPVHRVTAGNLGLESVKVHKSKKGRFYTKHSVPAHIETDTGKGMIQRQCTRDFKIDIIRRCAKMVKKAYKAEKVIQWIGFSLDEIYRLFDSHVKWIETRFPLIEMRLKRYQCLLWLKKHGYPEPSRSACSFCPYHSDREWQNLKIQDPESFQQAVEYEKEFQRSYSVRAQRYDKFTDKVPYLHTSLQPLETVDFDPCRDQADMFVNECEGMCGV